MATEVRERGKRRDRWVAWLVIGVLVVALALGWVVKLAAEGRVVSFQNEGVSGFYPAGWLKRASQSPYLLQVEDAAALPVKSTLTLQRRPLQGDLRRMSATLAAERALGWGECNAYRVLWSEEPASFYGRTGMHVTFAYIDPTVEGKPVVMMGEDYIFQAGDWVYIATVTAAEGNMERAGAALQRFVAGLQVP